MTNRPNEESEKEAISSWRGAGDDLISAGRDGESKWKMENRKAFANNATTTRLVASHRSPLSEKNLQQLSKKQQLNSSSSSNLNSSLLPSFIIDYLYQTLCYYLITLPQATVTNLNCCINKWASLINWWVMVPFCDFWFVCWASRWALALALALALVETAS